MRLIVTDGVTWSVGLSVCYTSKPCKNGWTDRLEMSLGLRTRVGPPAQETMY